MYDLPSDNPEDPGLPDEFHFFQPLLLLLTFQPTHWSWEQVFSACDLNLYYDLVEGNYQRVNLTDNRFFMPELGLSLGLWSGRFREINAQWLRWMTPSGELIPTDNEQAILAEERANTAEERATAAEERAIAAEERAQQLAQRLRELGIDPDNL